MKAVRIPAIVLAMLLPGFVAYLAYSSTLLPEQVASHFGTKGQADSWMSRSGYLLFMGATGLAVPLISVLVVPFIRRIPVQLVNLPNKQYWLSPERKEQTCSYISGSLLWLACLEVVFFAGINYLTVEANHTQPAQLDMERFWPLMIGFAAAVVLWSIVIIVHFLRVRLR